MGFNHQKWDNKGKNIRQLSAYIWFLSVVAINIEGWLKPSWIENKIPGSTDQRYQILAMVICWLWQSIPLAAYLYTLEAGSKCFACLQS
jgi:hypothetical protein